MGLTPKQPKVRGRTRVLPNNGNIIFLVSQNRARVGGSSRQGQFEWLLGDTVTISARQRSSTGGPALWVNGKAAVAVGNTPKPEKYGLVGFYFTHQVGAVDNVKIEGILDMEWFNELTKRVR